MSSGWVRRTGLWTGRVLLGMVIVFALAVGYGTTAGDAEKMRVFGEATHRWQTNPDFRKVEIEYVELGATAMNTKAAWISTTQGIIWLRSIPGLPAHIAVNPTSRAHYDNFTRGPLSAYLHLTDETSGGMKDTIKMLKYLVERGDLSDEGVRRDMLQKYTFPGYTVAMDAGAAQSVRRLVDDVDPSRGFQFDDNMRERYRSHIAAVAASLGYPTEVSAMTAEQQSTVRAQLDAHIKEADYELWRSKQVNDWLNGLWAQVYGTMYGMLIQPTITVRAWGRVVGPTLLLTWIALAWWKRRRPSPSPVTADPDLDPRLALEVPDANDPAQ